MRTIAPSATENLRASVKAARSIGRWGIELTTQEADAILAEHARLAEANPQGGMTPQGCALGQHPGWATEGEKSLPCPWCVIEQLTVERDQARLVAQRIYGERISFWQTPGPEYLNRLGLDALPPWLLEEGGAHVPAEPVHFTTTGTLSACGRRAAHAPKGVTFTLAFDPDDEAIDCRACRLYLKGLRAAAGSLR